ncbi:MAG TPA: hypothetical protein C5S50_01015 [Methanosarcinaceae archaeon]|nr:hypothetical protein [Methanosarcinaceae archaeon]HJH30787.1 hypothetical protein [Methanosarcinaceae archaeon]
MKILRDITTTFEFDNLSKIFLSLGYLALFTIAYIIYKTPNATGYELTIYNAFPSYFFLLFILIYFMGFSIIFKGIWNRTEKIGSFVPAIILILLANGVFLSLSNLHGYWLEGRGEGDVLAHIGYMKDIIINGNIGTNNYYPMLHLIGVIIFYFANISLENISTIIYVFFSLSFPLFIYFLSSSMLNNMWERLLITSFSLTLIFSLFHLRVHPSIWSIIIVPLLLGAIQYKIWKQKRSMEFSIIILILAFLIIYMHPMTAVFLIIMLSCYAIVTNFVPKADLYTKPINTIIIIFTVFLSWYLSFIGIQRFTRNIYNSLFIESETSIASFYMDVYSTAQLSFYTTIKYLFWQYGHLIILIGISTLFIIITLRKLLLHKNNSLNNVTYMFLQISGFLTAVVFTVTYFVEFNIVRVFRFSVMISVITCGLFFIDTINIDRKRVVIAFITIMFLSSFFVFNVYSGPVKSSVNSQMTLMEHDGLKWILTHKNNMIYFVSGTNIYKNSIYFFGGQGAKKNRVKYIRATLPNHYGVDEYSSLGVAVENKIGFNESFYTIYNKHMEINYQVLPEEVWDIATRYNKEVIENDASVNIIYSNGEFENWLVQEH